MRWIKSWIYVRKKCWFQWKITSNRFEFRGFFSSLLYTFCESFIILSCLWAQFICCSFPSSTFLESPKHTMGFFCILFFWYSFLFLFLLIYISSIVNMCAFFLSLACFFIASEWRCNSSHVTTHIKSLDLTRHACDEFQIPYNWVSCISNEKRFSVATFFIFGFIPWP